MNILALDTSGPVCSVAVLEDGLLRYEARVVNRLTHSTSLMPMVEEALHKSGIVKATLSHIACVVGPGSFTGVRIGVAAAQGMARGLGLPCIAINALEAMAQAITAPDMLVCPIRDARSEQVYGAAFKNGKRLMEDKALKLSEYLQAIQPLARGFYFLGDGALAHGDKILSALGAMAMIAPAHLLQPGAASAAALTLGKAEEAVDPGDLRPLYLRAPQAERLRARQNEAL